MNTHKTLVFAAPILLVATSLFVGPTIQHDAESVVKSPTTPPSGVAGPECHPMCDTLVWAVSSDEDAGLKGLALTLSEEKDSSTTLRMTSVSAAAKDPHVITAIMREDEVLGQIDRKTIPSTMQVTYFGRVLPKHQGQDDRSMLISFEGKDGRGHRVAGVGIASGAFACAPKKTCERKGEATMKFTFEKEVDGLKLPVAKGTASFTGSDEELDAVGWLLVSK